MGIESHVITDHESGRTFEVVVLNEKTVIGLKERKELDSTPVWLDVPKDDEWWEQWQGEADSGAFETPDDMPID